MAAERRVTNMQSYCFVDDSLYKLCRRVKSQDADVILYYLSVMDSTKPLS